LLQVRLAVPAWVPEGHLVWTVLAALAELDLSGRGVEGACVDDVAYRVVASSRS